MEYDRTDNFFLIINQTKTVPHDDQVWNVCFTLNSWKKIRKYLYECMFTIERFDAVFTPSFSESLNSICNCFENN